MKKQIKVLLIEDNLDDVELIKILSSDIKDGTLIITSVEYLADGIKILSEDIFDIILLDLYLLDSSGIKTLVELNSKSEEVPIIVLTGHDDVKLASEAVQLGAQDYLVKGQIDGELLWRSMNYAIDRKKLQVQLEQAHQRERQDMEIYSLKQISKPPKTEVTAKFLGITSIEKYSPTTYDEIIQRYNDLLDRSIEKRIYKVKNDLSEDLRSLSELLGFLKAGPRDLIKIHTKVLEDKCRGAPQLKVQAYIEEGRIILIELMGYVVMFYRNYYIGNKNRALLREINSAENSGSQGENEGGK